MKDNRIIELLDMVSMAMFGRARSECLKNGTCVVCGSPAGSFSNYRAAEGWATTATCEACQVQVSMDTESEAG